MDAEVAEDPARRGDVVLVRRSGVVARHPDDVERADRPVGDEVAGGREAGVESTLEPHLELDPRRAHVLHDRRGTGEVDRDGLLAERREPGIRARVDQVGVGRGCGGDHDGIDRAEQVIGRGNGSRAGVGGDLLGSIGIHVGEHDGVHTGDRSQRDRVGLAHAADPDHPDAHPAPDGVRTASPCVWNVPRISRDGQPSGTFQ